MRPSGWSPPEPIRERMIEQRARQIADPVERLRFFRHIALQADSKAGAMRVGLPLLLPGLLVTSLLLMGLLFMPRAVKRDTSVVRALRPSNREPHERRVPAVWLVDKKNEYEIYSNGLCVETRLETDGRPRSYLVYDAASEEREAIDSGTQPAGIVYHCTETLQAPFEAGQNGVLKRIGENLLTFVRANRSYNYVIDRFGRVWRIVPDGAVANHAGWSIWSSDNRVWVNLNKSFLGVSFEGNSSNEIAREMTAPQVHAGKILTEMLRAKYQIVAVNCVTHAQVSVNPDNLNIGYHTDWAAGFPFEEMGLGDNYRRPVASLYAFGFAYDSSFINAAGEPLRAGLRLAETRLREEATARMLPLDGWRVRLQHRFRHIAAVSRNSGGREENTNER